jgi:DNA-cytosine methyltransferase
MKYISVCSGIEAASVAWHNMGWEPVAFSEIEPFPSEVLKIRFPNTPNWGDMTKFNNWPNATINLLVGGTPCQSFSVAGLRQGLKDPRGNLMLTFLGIAERYKPKWIVWENVPGVLSSNGGKDFGSFLGALGELGYGWAYRVLDAQWFGVAQRRKRVFVVGCLGDQRAAAEVLFESESVSRNPAPSREKRQAVTRTTEESVGGDSEWLTAQGHDVSPTVTSKWKTGYGGPSGGVSEMQNMVCAFKVFRKYANEKMDNFQAVIQPTIIDRAAFNQGENAQYEPRIEKSELMPSLVAKGPHAVAHAFKIRGGSPTETGEYGGTPGKAAGKGYLGSDELAFTLAAAQDQQIAFRKSKRAQSAEDNETWVDDGVSNTLNNFDLGDTRTTHAVVSVDTFNQTTNEHTTQTLGSSATDVNHYGAVINPPMAIRRLTPVECERLQGFPELKKITTFAVWLDHQNNCVNVEIKCRNERINAYRAEEKQKQESVLSAQESFNKNQVGNKNVAGLNVQSSYEPKVVEQSNLKRLFSSVLSAEQKNLFLQLIQQENFARQVAVINTMLEKETSNGREVLQLNTMRFTPENNGRLLALLFGQEKEVSVNDVENTIQEITKYTTSNLDQNIQSLDMNNQTWLCFVLSVIALFTHEKINQKIFFEISTQVGWTQIPWKKKPEEDCPDGPRYKACGNSMAVPCMKWIGNRIQKISERTDG